MDRNVSLDILKLSMAFMVVGLHAGFLSEISALGSYLTVQGVFRIAVPVFLIINGFYFFPVLAKGRQTTWLKRVFILYAVWMLFYSYFWFSLPSFSLKDIIELIKNIIVGYHHLWYIAGMLGAALLLCALQRFSSAVLVMTIVVSAALGILIQYLGNYHYFEGSRLDNFFNLNWFHRNALFFSYPFFCIGFLINKHRIHTKISLTSATTLSVLGLAFLLLESYINYSQASMDEGFDNYFSLLILCPFVFITFTKIKVSGNSKNIALYSSAVYFIHSFFLSLLKMFTDVEATMLTALCIGLSLLASHFLVRVNSKVKFIL